MSIVVLYIILGVSTAALVAVGASIYLRVRRLTRISQGQFFEAVKADLDWHHMVSAQMATEVAAQEEPN